MSAMKSWLKKILPPPVNSFMREINRIVAIEENNQELMKQLEERAEEQEKHSEEQQKIIVSQTELLKQQDERLQEIMNLLDKRTEEITNLLDKRTEEITNLLDKRIEEAMQLQEERYDQIVQQLQMIKTDSYIVRNHAWQNQRNTDEVLWAEIYNSTVTASEWLKNKTFSPGRWAVGYQYLYVVYRILNEIKPKNILELGLGQSTRLLSQYATTNCNIKHTVVEHDPEWIEFFQRDFQLSENSEIVQLERIYKIYREDDKVLAFNNFQETFSDKKFDFISIDAPLGGEAIIYARVDILDLIPECLAESFIIVVDDYNRQGEKNMVLVLEEKLHEKAVDYVKGVYSGKKDCIVICSENLKFVCSM